MEDGPRSGATPREGGASDRGIGAARHVGAAHTRPPSQWAPRLSPDLGPGLSSARHRL